MKWMKGIANGAGRKALKNHSNDMKISDYQLIFKTVSTCGKMQDNKKPS